MTSYLLRAGCSTFAVVKSKDSRLMVDHWVKCLTHKNQGPSLNSRNPCKNAGHGLHNSNPSTGETDIGRFLKLPPVSPRAVRISKSGKLILINGQRCLVD